MAGFGFDDPLDNNPLSGVLIISLPSSGELSLSGVAISVGQTIDATEIVNGNLVFIPVDNANGNEYDNFQFSVIDSGVTLNNGNNTAIQPNEIVFDVVDVSDPPQRGDKIVSVNEDTTYVFTPR